MRVFFFVITLSLVCFVTHGNFHSKLQCKDENNEPVDWYVLYKLPKVQTSSNRLVRKGLAYLYITNSTTETGWQLSTKSIGSNDSIPGITLAPLYDRRNESEILWGLYNDSPPNASDLINYGHTKGVVMANSDQGFWLIHSVPNFPFPPNDSVLIRFKNATTKNLYSYPDSGTIYGQSFLCISLGSDQFNVVGKQLMYNEIPVYAKNIPETLGKQYTVLTNATNKKRVKEPPYNHKTVIRSLGSLEFTSFAKSRKWGKDIYGDFVAPQLQADLYVQSWLNGRGKLPTTCHRRKIYNVKSLKFDVVNVDYTSSHDHSKWAIAVNPKSNNSWVCIGDINRADTQYSRGGGAVCFKNVSLWRYYRNVVNDVEPCHST